MTMSSSRIKDNRLFLLAGIVILCLIGVQVYWIAQNVYLQKTAVERQLKEDMDGVVKQVEENAYCFSVYSKAYLKQEGIYIIRQKYRDDKFVAPKDKADIDTLDLYNVFYDEKDTSFYKDRTLGFDKWPATVDISLKFTFTGAANPVIKRTDTNSYNLQNLTSQNYREVLSNKFRIDEAIDIAGMDALIKKALKKNNLDTVYKAGIRKAGAPGFEYLAKGTTPADIAHTNIKATFLQNRFDKPYELLVAVPDSFGIIIRTMSAMMISSGIIIIILILSYAYFVRTILNQKKLSEMKNTFINNITHEFRTPITNIKLALENWNETKRNDELYARIIAEENEHLERNVEQVLLVATAEHGRRNMEMSKTDVVQLIHETVNSFKIRLAKLKGNVSFDMQPAHLYVTGDYEQLKIMLGNLLDNAIKYSGVAPDIRISARHRHNVIEIEVTDKGPGMPAETQKHIFDRFYRGYTGDRHDVKGFGLGLSYVKQIVDAHNGTIAVKSKEGEGTRFTIVLPAYKIQAHE